MHTSWPQAQGYSARPQAVMYNSELLRVFKVAQIVKPMCLAHVPKSHSWCTRSCVIK